MSAEQWQPTPNPTIITLMRLISELAAVKCQAGKEESNQDWQLTFSGGGVGVREKNQLCCLIGFSEVDSFVSQI